MGIVTMGPPEDIVLYLKKISGVSRFVETGTYHANTSLWATEYFDSVMTVEFSESLYKKNIDKFKTNNKLQMFFGHTRDFLKNEVLKSDTRCLFWLDAHWCSGESYGENDQCPLLEELELIVAHSTEHIILIDDARLFCSPPPKPNALEEYPDISSILHVLDKKSFFTAILDDVIIAVPKKFEKDFKTYLQDRNTAAWLKRAEDMAKIENTGIAQKLKNKIKTLI